MIQAVRLWWLQKEDPDIFSTVLSTGANWSTGVQSQWRLRQCGRQGSSSLRQRCEWRRQEVSNGVIADWRIQRDDTKSIRT